MKSVIICFSCVCILFTISACSQKGCPGGMCPPSHQKFNKYARASNKNFRSGTFRSSKNLSYNKTRGRDKNSLWSRNNASGDHEIRRVKRKDSRGKKSGNDAAFLSFKNKKTRNNIEGKTFREKRSKKKYHSNIQRWSLFKKKNKREEGLWSPEIDGWHKKEKLISDRDMRKILKTKQEARIKRKK
jgi:hypothetical protein